MLRYVITYMNIWHWKAVLLYCWFLMLLISRTFVWWLTVRLRQSWEMMTMLKLAMVLLQFTVTRRTTRKQRIHQLRPGGPLGEALLQVSVQSCSFLPLSDIVGQFSACVSLLWWQQYLYLYCYKQLFNGTKIPGSTFYCSKSYFCKDNGNTSNWSFYFTIVNNKIKKWSYMQLRIELHL